MNRQALRADPAPSIVSNATPLPGSQRIPENVMTLQSVTRSLIVCALMCASSGASPAAQNVAVPAGSDLQQAINAARPGDTLMLAAGATYTGNFVLPQKEGTAYITIRTGGDDPALPRAGQRVAPSQGERLAKLKSPNAEPALRTAPGAHHWRIQLIDFPPTGRNGGDIIRLGDGGPAQNAR